MPTMAGESVVRAYRAMPNAGTPIVVLTALSTAEEHAARIGAIRSIVKPFDLDDLLAAVNDAMPPGAPRLRRTDCRSPTCRDITFTHGEMT
jgi:DNA-binding response OmpR family regulator